MALNVKLIQKYALKEYKEFLKKIEEENHNQYALSYFKNYSFRKYLADDPYTCDDGMTLPFCCSVDEVTFLYKYDLVKYILHSLAIEQGPKYIIHISDKNQKQYQHYLDLGFEVTKHYMGNHKKMLTWLELDLTKYTF